MSARIAVDRAQPPPPGPLRVVSFPEYETFELSNGIPVLFCPTDRIPVVTATVILPAGAVREEPTRAGLATLMGDLLESGTAARDASAIARELEMLGARLNIGTSWEATALDVSGLAERLAGALSIMAELIREPTFPDEEVARIRHEQLAAILQRRAEPRGLANELANRFIYAPESPFSRPVSGTTGTVTQLHRADALDFHRRAVTPKGAGIVIAGMVDVEEVRRVTEEHFGAWQGESPPVRFDLVKPRTKQVQLLVVDKPGSVQSEIRIGHIGTPRSSPDYFPILVMNTILGGAFSSRLNLNLRERHGFTYGVRSGFTMRRHAGPFLVSTAVQTEVTGAAVREILSELNRIRDAAVDAAELDDARSYIAGTLPLRLQTTDGLAGRLAELFLYDLPRSYLDTYSEQILAVTAAEVQAAAQNHIHPEALTILVLGDAGSVRPQLESLGLGSIEVVSNQWET